MGGQVYGRAGLEGPKVSARALIHNTLTHLLEVVVESVDELVEALAQGVGIVAHEQRRVVAPGGGIGFKFGHALAQVLVLVFEALAAFAQAFELVSGAVHGRAEVVQRGQGLGFGGSVVGSVGHGAWNV